MEGIQLWLDGMSQEVSMYVCACACVWWGSVGARTLLLMAGGRELGSWDQWTGCRDLDLSSCPWPSPAPCTRSPLPRRPLQAERLLA